MYLSVAATLLQTSAETEQGLCFGCWHILISLFVIMQACRQYHSMLQKVYGPSLILEPHVMDVDAVTKYDTSGALSILAHMLLSYVNA